MTILALDVGGSTIRGVVRDRAGGSEIASRVLPSTDGDPGLARLHTVARELSDVARDAGTSLQAVGVGMPEYVDREGWLTSADVLAWHQQPQDLLADVAPVVAVEADIRCAAIAELAARPETGDAVVISVGTGISHTAIHRGQVIRGARGEAIGLGQLRAAPPAAEGPRTEGPRTVEDLASGAGLVRRYRERTGHDVTDGAREIIALADDGDADALMVLGVAGDVLAYAVWTAVQLLDPDRVVLTGGLGSAPSHLHDRMHSTYADLTRSRPGAARIEISALGQRAGLVGAELVARRALEEERR